MKFFARIVFVIPFFVPLLLGCGGNAKPLTDEPSVENAKGTPVIEIADDFFDFGSIQEGEVVAHTFKIANTGDGVLVIKDVIPGCGCTTSKLNKEVLKPGDEARFEIIFDSKGWRGSQYKSVTLRTNAPNRERSVTIKANVVVK
ncbi:MAG: DUF1573 domain-containing protein [Bacteroidales bacterium]|nr:DUF1573 domain-containing protein [Bacteroidales bacterium]MBN2748745.1 DUF1573 domain-containing protein [Bacteroidales bacterium]